MNLNEKNKTIQEVLKKIADLTVTKDQVVYIRILNNDFVYRTCGAAPITGGIIDELQQFTMYDIINALFDNNLGYQIMVSEDFSDKALTVRMWKLSE